MNRTSNYGILAQNAIVTKLEELQQRVVLFGSILKIEDVSASGKLAVRFLKEDNENWETNKYRCEEENIVYVNEDFWPFLAAVSSPLERVKIAKIPTLCYQFMQLSPGSVVGYIEFGQMVLGTIKYVGNIKNIGTGFGIQLHERKNASQCNGTYLGINYFQCPPGYGVFSSIERVIPQCIL